MSLAMYLYPEGRVKDPYHSNGHCAQTERIDDQRYLSAELPAAGAHVSVLTYTLKDDGAARRLTSGPSLIVDIVEGKAREQKMVTVKAEDMAQQISTAGQASPFTASTSISTRPK